MPPDHIGRYVQGEEQGQGYGARRWGTEASRDSCGRGTWISRGKMVGRGQVAHLLLFHTIDLNKGVRVGLVSKGKENSL